MDCEDHVVPPVKFLEPYDSNQNAASLTLHENDAVHVQLTSGTSSSNREEERPPEPITGLEVALEQRTAMHRVWVASFADIYQPGISKDNIELLPLYHVPCVTLCTLSLSCQTTLTKRQKKKKKKKKKRLSDHRVSAPQS